MVASGCVPRRNDREAQQESIMHCQTDQETRGWRDGLGQLMSRMVQLETNMEKLQRKKETLNDEEAAAAENRCNGPSGPAFCRVDFQEDWPRWVDQLRGRETRGVCSCDGC